MTSETIVPLRWSDMDAMGHVNNAAYLTFLETAREPWFAALGANNDLMQFALRRVEIDYLSQLRFEDGAVRVTVRSAVSAPRASARAR